jgi:acetylornithine/N-succinyldiaminopimelate aminotransferase
LMVGVEMTLDVSPVVEAGYKNGLLLVSAGTDVIRFVPPLIAQKSDVDVLVERLSVILSDLNPVG